MVKRITTVWIKLVGSKKGVPILSNHNRCSFWIHLSRIWMLGVLILGFSQSPGFAGDIENKLSTNDGSTTFEVRDSVDSVVSHIDSDGNVVIKGGLRLDSAGAECTTSEDLIVDGNVGIGTTNTGAKLHVESDSTDSAVFIASHTTNGYGLVVSTNGCVGIGTNNPGVALDIRGGPSDYKNVKVLDGNNAALYVESSHLSIDKTLHVENYALGGYGLYADAFQHYFDGNVGIGTDSPVTPLEIKDTYTTVQACKGTTAALYAHASDSSITSALQISHADPTRYSIYSNGGTHFFQNEVGIGMTPYTGGSSKLFISGDVLFKGICTIGVESPWIESPGNDLKITAANGNLDIGGNLYLYGGNGWPNAGNVILAHNGGNVGVGTTTVGAKLHVVSDSTNSAVFIASHTTTGYGLVVSTNGYVGIGTNNPSGTLHVNATNGIYINNLPATNQASLEINTTTGELSYLGSSLRYKKDIRDLEINSEDVFKLRPVRFKWKKTDEEDIGLIAEEVNEVIPELVNYDKKGRPVAVEYDLISVYLLEVVKQQQQKISALEQTIAEIEKKLKKIYPQH